MSLIFIDGFDHYNAIRHKWQAGGSLDNPTFVAGRFGGQSLKKQFQNAQQSIRRSFPIAGDVTFGCALKTPGFSGITESYFRLENVAGTVILSINITSGGNINIVAGGWQITSAFALDNVQWNYLECHYIPKDTAGEGGIVEVKVNGDVKVTLDGASFSTTTEADDDVGGMGIMDNGTNSPRYLLDDLYILKNDGLENSSYLGDVRITTMFAQLDGDRNEWSPNNEPSNFLEVDDTTAIDSGTFVESGLIGAAEDYDNESFATKQVAPGAIYGVQVSNATLRTATGTIGYQNEMVIDGTRYSDGTEYTPGNAAYFVNTFVRDTDPSDGLTWTEDKVSNVNSGIVITAKEVI